MIGVTNMIVGIDVSQVIYGTGSSAYTRNLVKGLLADDPEVEYKLFGGSLRRHADLKSFYKSLEGNFKATAYPLSPAIANILWNQLHIINIENFLGDLDVFHSSDWTQPPTKAKKVTTIHDLSPLLFPQFTHPRIVNIHKKRLEWVKKEVDIVIVPSLSTKNDVTNYGIESKRVKIIPEAVESMFNPVKKEVIIPIKNKFGIKQNYLLFVGVNPRKNIERTVKAFVKVSSVVPLQLVIVGKPTNASIVNNPNIIFTGHISSAELIGLYSGAEALVYTSLYEGFGLPILEAFACLCPVVCSNISSLPEVAGDAAVLVDPLSVESIEAGIIKILQNHRKFIVRGKKRVKLYSWENNAKETLNIYKNLYNLS